MKHQLLPGTDLMVSPLCLGAASLGVSTTETEAFALLDSFVGLGGNFLDTARIYSDWMPGEQRRSERILGDWLRSRGQRDRLTLATKGAHPYIESLGVPRTSTAEICDDLEGSLRTLGTEVIDLYWLHRDDPSRPVAHFIDLLNRFYREGKIRAFGASNWSVDRLRAAHDYARASGQHGFCASQPFWCLGCQRALPSPIQGLVKLDSAAYRFHCETGLAVIPYTSQANGFFSKLALPKDQQPANLAQSEFYTPPNLAAGEVVVRLARAKNVPAGAIVLAYVRSRPFPVVPIIGSRTLTQLEDSVAALPVSLSPGELASLEIASASGLPG